MTAPTHRRPTLRPDGAPLGSLARFGGAPALVTPRTSVSYPELAGMVRERKAELGSTRRLVLLECHNDVHTVVSYLAALEGRHPVLLTGPDCRRDDLVATYRPDVVARGPLIDVLDPSGHDLHPELALLLSTSGSTGSPKLVRLSRDNIRSNAKSIATYLGLTADDRAATTLPMHYCYGLSVVNSHLLVGASLLLTEASVADEQFWSDFADTSATSFAGVPHVFDLLDSSGFADRELPTLRTVTQAGGRLDPDTVRRYARLGRERGFDLVVMYGQTEATARMAYLPPHLAAERAESIGIPIPGGSFRIDGDEEVGELVYSGENVMLGRQLGLPDHALEIHVLSLHPVTTSGKPDYGALQRQARAAAESGPAGPRGPVTPGRVRDLYAHLLGRPDATRGGQLHQPRRRLPLLRRGRGPDESAPRRPAA